MLGKHGLANEQLSLCHQGWARDCVSQEVVVCLQMMQDWLARYKLDRKALAGLAGNAQAVQAYQDYLQATVQDIVDDILTLLAPADDQQGS